MKKNTDIRKIKKKEYQKKIYGIKHREIKEKI